jgi:hypothetical protein
MAEQHSRSVVAHRLLLAERDLRLAKQEVQYGNRQLAEARVAKARRALDLVSRMAAATLSPRGD